MIQSDPEKIKFNHPDFKRCARGKYDYVFVFERPMFKTPNAEQSEKYRKNALTVESLGGQMIQPENQIAGENERFTADDILDIIRQLFKYYTELRFEDYWNGPGYYTVSIGASSK